MTSALQNTSNETIPQIRTLLKETKSPLSNNKSALKCCPLLFPITIFHHLTVPRSLINIATNFPGKTLKYVTNFTDTQFKTSRLFHSPYFNHFRNVFTMTGKILSTNHNRSHDLFLTNHSTHYTPLLPPHLTSQPVGE